MGTEVIHYPFVGIYLIMPKVKRNSLNFSKPRLIHDLPQRAVPGPQFEKILITYLGYRHTRTVSCT
jgi:hypothetical protein